jgi:hypothetical protein
MTSLAHKAKAKEFERAFHSGNGSIDRKTYSSDGDLGVCNEHAEQRFIQFEFLDPECLDVELNGRRYIRDSLGSRVALANDHASQTNRVRDEPIRVLLHNDLHIFGHFYLDAETVSWWTIAHSRDADEVLNSLRRISFIVIILFNSPEFIYRHAKICARFFIPLPGRMYGFLGRFASS